MQHPEISYTQRFGSLWNFDEPQYIGECSLPCCRHKEIYDSYEYFTDSYGNLFCSKEHAEQFYGLRPGNITF